MSALEAPSAGSSPSGHGASRGTGSPGSSVPDGSSNHQRRPRSLPPWIGSYNVGHGCGLPIDSQMQLLNQPPATQAPQHNNTPTTPQRYVRRVSKDGYVDIYEEDGNASAKQAKPTFADILRRRGGAERGRKWDHLRSADPVVVSGHLPTNTGSPWSAFVHSSKYGHAPNERSEVVDAEVLDKLQPGFNMPSDTPRQAAARRRRHNKGQAAAKLYKRVWRLVILHPLIPLAFRLTVLLTSILSLALSVRIFQVDGDKPTQTIVAIIVDSVAIPYIGYMTHDEYTGKPLGLRPATEKIALVLMDLFFIIFKSASTTLAFEAIFYHTQPEDGVTNYSRALAAFQTVSLISWTLNFTVNVFRLVQRLGGGEDEGQRQRTHWASHS